MPMSSRSRAPRRTARERFEDAGDEWVVRDDDVCASARAARRRCCPWGTEGAARCPKPRYHDRRGAARGRAAPPAGEGRVGHVRRDERGLARAVDRGARAAPRAVAAAVVPRQAQEMRQRAGLSSAAVAVGRPTY